MFFNQWQEIDRLRSHKLELINLVHQSDTLIKDELRVKLRFIHFKFNYLYVLLSTQKR